MFPRPRDPIMLPPRLLRVVLRLLPDLASARARRPRPFLPRAPSAGSRSSRLTLGGPAARLAGFRVEDRAVPLASRKEGMTVDPASARRIERAGETLSRVRDEVARAVVGQKAMVDRLLIGLLTGGHVLLEGVPGLAKTLAVSSLAKALSLKFRRIQFTPDLLPADLTGTLIYNPRDGSFTAKKGPLFTHLLLADEINRSPAKVQSALLEAMQERQVTLGDES